MTTASTYELNVGNSIGVKAAFCFHNTEEKKCLAILWRAEINESIRSGITAVILLQNKFKTTDLFLHHKTVPLVLCQT